MVIYKQFAVLQKKGNDRKSNKKIDGQKNNRKKV